MKHKLIVRILAMVLVGVLILPVGRAQRRSDSLLEIRTPYKYGDTEQSRALRAEVWRWDFHFASEIQKKDEGLSLAFDGANLHANTRHEALLYYTHRVHCLAWCVTNQQQAVEFTNAVERWITNLPTGPE